MAELFVNPWLLGGLSLAAAPILIHLLNRRRFQIHDWAAMDFLVQASVSNRRRLKFEDLVLLLLRILVILLLVFTVARPLVRGVGGWQEDERIVILDDSFSMDVASATSSVFRAARESATNRIQDAIGRSIPVTLRLGSRPDVESVTIGGVRDPGDPGGGETTGDAARDRRAIEEGSSTLQAIRELTPGDGVLRFGRVLEGLVEEAEADRSPRRRSVVLISDFRRTDWLGDGARPREALQAVFRELVERGFDERFGFQLVDVGRPDDVGNLAVVDFRVDAHHVLTGVPVKIVVEVRNFSGRARGRVEGRVEVADASSRPFRPKHRIPLPPLDSIPAGENATVEAEHTFEKPGQYLLRVTLDEDALARDDTSHAVVTVRESLRALVVDGDPGADRFAGESGFLVAALSPRGQLRTGIQPTLRTDRITAESLKDTDVVLILNRKGLEAPEWHTLERFVNRGGGLVFFLGNRVDAAAYTPPAAGTPGKEDSFLFPALLGELRKGDTRVPMNLGGFQHPALEIFQGVEGSSLQDVRFDRYLAMEPAPGATVVARFADGGDENEPATPAIIEAVRGKGRVVIFNTSADRDWSDWPTDPSYPIVLQEWVRHLAPARDAEHHVRVGEPLQWRTTPGRDYEVVKPDGERVPVAHDPERAIPLTTAFSGTDLAGFYRVIEKPRNVRRLDPVLPGRPSAAAGEGRSFWYACQRPVAESDLEPLGEARLRSLLESSSIRFALGREVAVDAFEQELEGELWKWLAVAAGAVLLVELLLAWWFGRR